MTDGYPGADGWAPARPPPTRWLLFMFGVAACLCIVLLNCTGVPFAPSRYGFIFNSMALHLVEGRFDVDPAAVLDEGFLRNGRTYAYFGILPAVLRMPLVPLVDLATVQVEGAYRLAAMMLATAGGWWLVRALFARITAGPQFPRQIFLLAVVFSGPVIMIGPRSAVYNEVVLWSWALSVWFLALLVPALDPSRSPSGSRLSALAIIAGCAVHTRPTMGLGLLTALALLMIVLAWRDASGGHGPGRFFRAAVQWRLIAPASIAFAFLAAAGVVNQARWGNPLTFAEMSLQTQMLTFFPDRLPRLDAYGLFNLRRLGLGIIYYFFPFWIFTRDERFLFHDDIARLFDAFEMPPSSFFLTDPLTVTLAAIGLAAALRRQVSGVARGPALAVMVGLALPPALLLVAWYMAFRYRADFMPLFLLSAGFGALRVSEWMAVAARPAQRRAMLALSMLLTMQVVAAFFFGFIYLISPYGPSLRHAPVGIPAYYRGVLLGP